MYCYGVFSRKSMIKIKIVLFITFLRNNHPSFKTIIFCCIFFWQNYILLSVFFSFVTTLHRLLFLFSDTPVSWYPTERNKNTKNTACWTTYGGYRLWCGRFWMLEGQIKLKQPRWLSKKEHKKMSLYWISYKDLVTFSASQVLTWNCDPWIIAHV